MDYKKDILELLDYLKKSGFTRAAIEKELEYGPNYITEAISRGGNEKMLRALRFFRNELVHKGTIKYTEMNADKVENNSPDDEIRAKYIRQLEKDIDRLEKENERLGNILQECHGKMASNLTEVQENLRTIAIRQEAAGETVLGSLERLEKKPKSALVAAADKRREQIDKEWQKHGNRVAGGK